LQAIVYLSKVGSKLSPSLSLSPWLLASRCADVRRPHEGGLAAELSRGWSARSLGLRSECKCRLELRWRTGEQVLSSGQELGSFCLIDCQILAPKIWSWTLWRF